MTVNQTDIIKEINNIKKINKKENYLFLIYSLI